MSYVINKTNGGTLVVLNDGVVDTSVSSLNLIGKNVSNFGDQQNENFVHLLENFAYSQEPRSVIQGQLWFDSSANVFRPAVYDGKNWRPLAVCLYSNTTTDILVNAGGANFTASRPGDFWFDSVKKQLHVVTSGTDVATEMVMIGPEGVPNFGTTKLASVAMKDSVNASHPVIQMVLDGEVIGVLSNASFTSDTAGTNLGFPKVNRGLTLKNFSTSSKVVTTSTDVALYGILDHLDLSFTRNTNAEHLLSNWTVDTGHVLNFGTNGESSVSWNQASSSLVLSSSSLVKLQAGSSSLTYNGTSLVSSLAGLNVGSSSFVLGTAYVSTLSSGSTGAFGSIEGNWNLTTDSKLSPAFDLGADLGSANKKFSNIFTRKISAGTTGISQLDGIWNLTTGSLIAPLIDQGNNLGTATARYNSVYTKGISANSAAESISVVGSPVVDGNITPSSTLAKDLGSASLRWNVVYARTINASSATYASAVATNLDAQSLGTNSLSAVNASIANLGFTTLVDAAANSISRFDVDTTLAANSHNRLSTQKAVKTYVDTTASYLLGLINDLQNSLAGQIAGIRTVPAGAVFHVAMQSPPSGYLVCNGSAQSTSAYPDLFAAIGYTYGGSGGTFYVPDLRGQFIRGWDAGRGIDAGRGFATSQLDDYKSHKHGIKLSHEQGGSHDQNGFPQTDWTGGMVFHGPNQPDGTWCYPDGSGNPLYSNGGSETRPKNVALLPIIKT